MKSNPENSLNGDNRICYPLVTVTALFVVICVVYWLHFSDRKLVLVVALLFALVPAALLLAYMRGALITVSRKLVVFGSVLGFFLPSFRGAASALLRSRRVPSLSFVILAVGMRGGRCSLVASRDD